MSTKTYAIRLGTGACFDFKAACMELTSNGAVFKDATGEIIYVVRDYLTIQLVGEENSPCFRQPADFSVIDTAGKPAVAPQSTIANDPA